VIIVYKVYYKNALLRFRGLYCPPGAVGITFMMDGCAFWSFKNIYSAWKSQDKKNKKNEKINNSCVWLKKVMKYT